MANTGVKYTIKSISDEGEFYLVKDWRKNKELWVNKSRMDMHPQWWFTSSGKALQSLKSLLKVMDDYLADDLYVIDDQGNETPVDVKALGFDYIPEYWDDDIDACDNINGATEPNSPDVDKTKLVRQVIKQAKEIRDYFQSHNNNLNRKQEQYLEDLSDGIDNESVAAIRGAIENMKYNSKNLRSEQYNLIMDLYDEFNLAGGKFEGMGYPEDDIDACDKVTASTDTSSIVNKIYSVMMNYEYGYDPDMADINSMLQELTGMGVHVDNSRAFKKAWVSAHNKAERKTWGSSGDAYHYDSLTPSELEAIENYDTEYWEYVKDHPFNLKPASITSSTDTKYFANMVSASSFDSAYDENDNLYQFHVAGYLGDDYRGLMEDWYTNDFEEALEHAFGMGSQGLFVEIENQVDGRSRKLTPEEWEDAAEWGEYPDHIREDLAL